MKDKYSTNLTPETIFYKYILPETKNNLNKYLWTDLFAGEGALILPLLGFIKEEKRNDFFKYHIFLSDIQKSMVEKCKENALKYNIKKELLEKRIKQRDNIKSFPKLLLKEKFKIYHITNPPYQYIVHMNRNKTIQSNKSYFKNNNKGYQDLYQIAMINDLRNNIENLIYIIPTNFLYGDSISKKIRKNILFKYFIKKCYIFEKNNIFDSTGSHFCIIYLKKKLIPSNNIQKFTGIKDSVNGIKVRYYKLQKEFNYRAGSEFDEFIKKNKKEEPLNTTFYLTKNMIKNNKGNEIIKVIDSNIYNKTSYEIKELKVNKEIKKLIKSNILYVKTIDTGTENKRAGLHIIKEDFNVDGIYCSKNPTRTAPIQLFLTPILNIEEQNNLKNYFNHMLEYFRKKLDSEFMTTFKSSGSKYIRKYLSLTQTKNLIKTFIIKND